MTEKNITVDKITVLAATGEIGPLIRAGLNPADATAIHVGAYAATLGASEELMEEAAVSAGFLVLEGRDPDEVAAIFGVALEHVIREGYASITDGLAAEVAALTAENALLEARSAANDAKIKAAAILKAWNDSVEEPLN